MGRNRPMVWKIFTYTGNSTPVSNIRTMRGARLRSLKTGLSGSCELLVVRVNSASASAPTGPRR